MSVSSSFNPKRVAVIGPGTMGAQVAAGFASIGCHVLLYGRPGSKSPNEKAEAGLAAIAKMRPAPFYLESDLRLIKPVNLRDDLALLREVDLVIEAILEKFDEKVELFTTIAPYIGEQTKVATNTSSISIAAIAAEVPETIRSRFIGGLHWFNPTRLPLLELIFAEHVSADDRRAVAAFFSDRMGKDVIEANDRPGFVANRVGMFVSMYAVKQLASGEFNIPELEVLTGELVGRPRSATFRTCDLVGLATFLNVTQYLFASLPDDPKRETLTPPPFLVELAKKKGTFSMKDRSSGKILSLDLGAVARGENPYQPLTAEGLPDLSAVKRLPSPVDRIKALMAREDKVGSFIRGYIAEVLNYCAWRIPEVSDGPATIDTALKAGFAWKMGPFELWNGLGVSEVAALMTEQGLSLPEWVTSLVAAGTPIPTAPPQQQPGIFAMQLPDAAVYDLGDGVAQIRFASKKNTLSFEFVNSLNKALDAVESDDWRGLVIGDGVGDAFCVGANLAEIAAAAQAGEFALVEGAIKRLQEVLVRLYSFSKPVVGVLKGMALGGGAELAAACPLLVAHPESYVGLVELGAGVIPAGCGTANAAYWAASQARAQGVNDAAQVHPFLPEAFLRIAQGKVTSSAHEAIDAGVLSPKTRIVMRADQLVAAAKAEVLSYVDGGYVPRSPRGPCLVLGAEGRAVLEAGINGFLASGAIGEYDAQLARTLAYVITGGNLQDIPGSKGSGPRMVPLEYLLRLEREQFIKLLQQEGTHRKMAAILKRR